MSTAAAAVLVLYGLTCPDPCPVGERSLVEIERSALKLLASRGFEVRPAAPDDPRPTGGTSTVGGGDVATMLTADRVVALDLERDARTLWITQFVRGVVGPWAVDKVACEPKNGALECPTFERLLTAGLRPRTALDIDLVSALRGRSKAIGKCIAEEDLVPAAERIFGRVEMDLVVEPAGPVKVKALAPARVAKSKFGDCLRAAMEAIDVGPFEGAPIPFSIPIDL